MRIMLMELTRRMIWEGILSDILTITPVFFFVSDTLGISFHDFNSVSDSVYTSTRMTCTQYDNLGPLSL